MNQRQNPLPARLQRWRVKIRRSQWWMKASTHGRWNLANLRDCRSAGSRIRRSKWPSRRKDLDLRPRHVPLELLLLKWHPRPRRRLPRRFPHQCSLLLRLSRLPPSLNAGPHLPLKRRSLHFLTGRNHNLLRPNLRRSPKCSSNPPLPYSLRSLRSRRFHPLLAPHPNKPQLLPHLTRRWMTRSRIPLPSASSNSVRSSAWTVR